MEGIKQGKPVIDSTAQAMHFREQTTDEREDRNDATIAHDGGRLEVSADEDTGGDPYNHTGTFKRTTR